MTVDIHKLIAAVNPDVFCDSTKSEEVKSLVSEGLKNKDPRTYIIASDKAKPKASEFLDLIDVDNKNGAFTLVGLKNPIEKHFLSYDSFGEGLEQIYFWILDNVGRFGYFKEPDKVVDSFVSSVGSGFFTEYMQKSSSMQQEVSRTMGNINTVVRSILNLIYDLKEFKTRLEMYKDLHSKDENVRRDAKYSIKQVWLDQVDIKKGNSSIKALAVGGANQPNFVTLIDAFMAADNIAMIQNPIDKGGLDLNERVKRLLSQRYGEFERWVSESEIELTKRYNIEKNYLKSQMASLQMYVKWVKPYMKAAKNLQQTAMPNASVVNVFNTSIFELVLIAKGEYDPLPDIQKGDLPQFFKDLDMKKFIPIMIVDFKFRSAPERVQQGSYGFRGKVDVGFTSYALSEEEYSLLMDQIKKDDLDDGIDLIEQATGDSLEIIKQDVSEFLDDSPKKEENEEEHIEEDINPFSALFSLFSGDKKKSKKKEKKENILELEKDTDYEKVLRSLALIGSRKSCAKFYEIYKKAHAMPAFSTV